ncbi:Hypothetical protein CINCED_3A002067 [Cinara cedri]|uniref:Uncharacterized protein n=1 Tax=Cinara cedri TaxID=506608 RepID=A0A5E4MG88_9HEMI|nr:Hypothetical protein CINCED_3A002067 [Cinara cedri]
MILPRVSHQVTNCPSVLTFFTSDEYDERSESVNDSFQKNAVAINNKPTSSLTLSKILASPHVNSCLQEKTVAKAKSPKIGVSRNTTTALPKKVVKSNELPKINVVAVRGIRRAAGVRPVVGPVWLRGARLRDIGGLVRIRHQQSAKSRVASLRNPVGQRREVNGTDGYFDAASSNVPRRSRRGDGDAANVTPSRKPFGRFRSGRDAEKHAAGKSAVGKPPNSRGWLPTTLPISTEGFQTVDDSIGVEDTSDRERRRGVWQAATLNGP